MKQHSIIFFALLLVFGCDVTEDSDGNGAAGRVYVANQGNFSDANGSVTIIDPDTDTVETTAISGLGSIVQSVAAVDGRLYVMANSANRIDVFDLETLDQIAQIDSVVSPRYMLVDGNIAYVTGLYGSIGQFDGGLVTVLDLESYTKREEIQVGDNPEGLALVGDRLYVANHGFGGGETVSVIDTDTREVVETIVVECRGPRFLAADNEEQVFVFCTGETIWGSDGIVGRSDGAVRVLDGETGEIIQRIVVDGQIASAGPGQDAFLDVADDIAFAVLDGSTILQFDTDDNVLMGSIGPIDGAPISAVAYEDGRLYLGRSNGFTTTGDVSIHMLDGAEVARFEAGIVPTYVAFSE